MPSEQMWDAFFNPAEILAQLNIDAQTEAVIDIGCGYGTFLLPLSALAGKIVIGIDIDNEMIGICRAKVERANLANVELIQGDVYNGRLLKEIATKHGRFDYITLFNILHCEEPVKLLQSIYEILNEAGRIGVTHWKYEKTPRGPSMEIRPKPEFIVKWAAEAGFILRKSVELPPFHYGMVFEKAKMA